MVSAFARILGGVRTAHAIGSAGALLTGGAIAWWALVFFQVHRNTDLPLQQSAACLFYTSDLCSLAMSLCRGWHVFGFKRYSSDLLWAGIAVFSTGFLLGTIFDRRGQEQ